MERLMTRLIKALGALVVAIVVSWPVTARGQDSCAGLTTKRNQMKTAIERIQAEKLPEERLEDLNIVLVELIDFLNANVKDSGEVQEKIKEIQERIPESDRPMIQKANEFLTGVSGVYVIGAGPSGSMSISKPGPVDAIVPIARNCAIGGRP